MEQDKKFSILTHVGRPYLLSFILVTACFALWGFANDATNPMVNAFSKIFRISNGESMLVPIAYHLGYFLLAFPAAIVIQKYSYKHGILTGLFLFALGSLLFIPSRELGSFYPFLMAYFIMTCGLSFLETSCNPYIYSMGPEESGIRRLNAAQAFNPIGAILGMYIAMGIHARMSPMSREERLQLPLQQFDIIKGHDLGILVEPYLYIGAVILVLLALIFFTRMPEPNSHQETEDLGTVIQELYQHRNYREGVIAEFFYIGAQITCWTFIIQYGVRIFTAEGMEEQAAEVLAQKYNLVAMFLFAAGRFICTWLLRWFTPSRMLSVMAILGIVAVLGAILFTDRNGLYCLVAVSGCLSLMFPTIYGIALRDIGGHIKYAGAGLVMAIIGGSVFPPMQVFIIEERWSILGLPSTNVSFLIPLICLVVVAWYGHRAYVRYHLMRETDGQSSAI